MIEKEKAAGGLRAHQGCEEGKNIAGRVALEDNGGRSRRRGGMCQGEPAASSHDIMLDTHRTLWPHSFGSGGIQTAKGRGSLARSVARSFHSGKLATVQLAAPPVAGLRRPAAPSAAGVTTTTTTTTNIPEGACAENVGRAFQRPASLHGNESREVRDATCEQRLCSSGIPQQPHPHIATQAATRKQ